MNDSCNFSVNNYEIIYNNNNINKTGDCVVYRQRFDASSNIMENGFKNSMRNSFDTNSRNTEITACCRPPSCNCYNFIHDLHELLTNEKFDK